MLCEGIDCGVVKELEKGWSRSRELRELVVMVDLRIQRRMAVARIFGGGGDFYDNSPLK